MGVTRARQENKGMILVILAIALRRLSASAINEVQLLEGILQRRYD